MGHHDPTYEQTLDPLDHDYEGLDNYADIAQQNKVIQAPSTSAQQFSLPKPSSNEYKLTQCPAYGTIAYKW